jgi:hypothetical protein
MCHSPDQQRQAGAECEITPEMNAAGMAALMNFYSDELYDEAQTVVDAVYRAMRGAALKDASQPPPERA